MHMTKHKVNVESDAVSMTHFLIVLSTSRRQSTIVLLCLCTAVWSTFITFNNVLNATYLQNTGIQVECDIKKPFCYNA